SLAHELNQPLCAIVADAQAAQRMLQAEAPDLDEVRLALGDIAGEGTRASEIIARVRTMLRKGAAERQPLDLNDVAREVAELIRRDLAARRLSVDLLLAETLPPVRGDRVQLQQVLLNLLSNGADAIEAAGGGRRQLEIRTALVAPATVLEL